MSRMERLAALIRELHVARILDPVGERNPRGWKPRPRPKTAIISEAALRCSTLRGWGGKIP